MNVLSPLVASSLSGPRGWLGQGLASEFRYVLPGWEARYSGCLRRFRNRPPPPHWSVCDWMTEVAAIAAAAAVQAKRDFQWELGRELGSFVWWRMQRAVLKRYREEWRYGQHLKTASVESVSFAGEDLPSDNLLDGLREGLARLSTFDRQLVQLLFTAGLTESEVAGRWGLSQQAVSKRKTKIIKNLRKSFTET